MAREPSAQTRQKILDVALELFGRQGYDHTSLREISERLSFTKAALYYHFKAKEDILQALAGDLLDEVEQIAQAALAAPDRSPAARAALLGDLVDLVLANRATAELLLSEHQSLSHTDLGERAKQTIALMRQALMPADPTPEDRLRATAALAIVQSPLGCLADPPPTMRDLIIELAVFALGGPAKCPAQDSAQDSAQGSARTERR